MRLKEQAKVTEHKGEPVLVDVTRAVVMVTRPLGTNGSREPMNEKAELETLLAHLKRPECQAHLSRQAHLELPGNCPPDENASLSAKKLEKLKSEIRRRRESGRGLSLRE